MPKHEFDQRHPLEFDESLVECHLKDGTVTYEDRCIRHDGGWHELGKPHVSLFIHGRSN